MQKVRWLCQYSKRIIAYIGKANIVARYANTRLCGGCIGNLPEISACSGRNRGNGQPVSAIVDRIFDGKRVTIAAECMPADKFKITGRPFFKTKWMFYDHAGIDDLVGYKKLLRTTRDRKSVV